MGGKAVAPASPDQAVSGTDAVTLAGVDLLRRITRPREDVPLAVDVGAGVGIPGAVDDRAVGAFRDVDIAPGRRVVSGSGYGTRIAAAMDTDAPAAVIARRVAGPLPGAVSKLSVMRRTGAFLAPTAR
ncbi:MAG: hypothetical protein ACR2JC_06425 [Chloroflexota bacterium]